MFINKRTCSKGIKNWLEYILREERDDLLKKLSNSANVPTTSASKSTVLKFLSICTLNLSTMEAIKQIDKRLQYILSYFSN